MLIVIAKLKNKLGVILGLASKIKMAKLNTREKSVCPSKAW